MLTRNAKACGVCINNKNVAICIVSNGQILLQRWLRYQKPARLFGFRLYLSDIRNSRNNNMLPFCVILTASARFGNHSFKSGYFPDNVDLRKFCQVEFLRTMITLTTGGSSPHTRFIQLLNSSSLLQRATRTRWTPCPLPACQCHTCQARMTLIYKLHLFNLIMHCRFFSCPWVAFANNQILRGGIIRGVYLG